MTTPSPLEDILRHLRETEGETTQFDEEAILAASPKRPLTQSGIAIKVLSVVGGILACAAFLGFLALAGLFDSPSGMLIFGIGCIAGAILLGNLYDRLTLDTVSIALFAIGFVLLGTGLAGWEWELTPICVTCMVLALVALAFTRSYALAFASVLILHGGMLVLISHHVRYTLIHLYTSVMALWLSFWILKEAAILTFFQGSLRKKLTQLYQPVRVGLVCSFLAGLVFLGVKGLFPVTYVWVSSVTTILAVLYLVYKLLETFQVQLFTQKLLILAMCTGVLLPTAFSPAISGAVLLLLLSFRVRYRTGFVVAICALVYFVSQYYYDLDFTLLVKSGIMVASGLLFLACYGFIHKSFPAHENV